MKVRMRMNPMNEKIYKSTLAYISNTHLHTQTLEKLKKIFKLKKYKKIKKLKNC